MEPTINYEMEKYISKLETKRKEALSSQDAKNYTSLCDQLGLEPEDKYLYEVGILELTLNKE